VHVLEELNRSNRRAVVALDNCRFASAPHLRKVQKLAELRRFDLLADDVETLFAGVRPEAVIHLAGVHQAAFCESHRTDALRINVETLERVLAASSATGVRRIFIASSSAVYAPSESPYHEGDAVEPPDFYGLTKAINEQQIRLFSARHPNVHCAIGRLFNVVGGFETSPRLAPEVVRRALLGDVIPVGNLTPRRDYVHVKDVARAVAAMTFDNDAPLDVCNIGSGVDWSVEELIGVVGRILGRDLRMQPQPELIRENERMLISARIDKITERYNWRPRHGPEEAMRDAIAFAQEAAS
jgi:UDP-glucose 4-epimerase